jgi:DNA-binding Xre family transcriptional regulator/Holliday junction resolvase-like predicted endonuclease
MSSENSSRNVQFPRTADNVHVDVGKLRSESELRAAVVDYLTRQGVVLANNVVCLAGEPDIVTADHDLIVEVKWRLTKKAICAALGQTFLYQEAINPHARLVIVGYATAETLALLPLITALGIELICWPNGWLSGKIQEGEEEDFTGQQIVRVTETGTDTKLIKHDTASNVTQQLLLPRQAGTSNSRSLKWNIAALAQLQGISNAPQLAFKVEMNRQGLYGIWNGTAAQVSLEILGRLAWALRASPGDWFVWELSDASQEIGTISQSSNSRPRLLWAIARKAEERGLDALHLSFRTEVHLASIKPIWQGIAQAVMVATLAKIALALDTPRLPFDIGELFTWED